jgi:hypothetical protein
MKFSWGASLKRKTAASNVGSRASVTAKATSAAAPAILNPIAVAGKSLRSARDNSPIARTSDTQQSLGATLRLLSL